MSDFLRSVERALNPYIGSSYKKEQIAAGIKHSRNLEEAIRRQRALDKVTSRISPPEEKAEYIAAERRSPESQQFRKKYKQAYDAWEELGKPNKYGEPRSVSPEDRAYEEALKKRQNYVANKKHEEKLETRRVLSELDRFAPTKEEYDKFRNFLDSGLSYEDYRGPQKERGLSDKALKQIKRGKIPLPSSASPTPERATPLPKGKGTIDPSLLPNKRALLKKAKRNRDRKK
tara:strand:+ start:3053 stop:3745 length:693 start_codon:yes stop_codon:yes gene_type:complete